MIESPNVRLSASTSLLLCGQASDGICPLSLHDALPILRAALGLKALTSGTLRLDREDITRASTPERVRRRLVLVPVGRDRKSTRLNSSHSSISYAVFCLKKKT